MGASTEHYLRLFQHADWANQAILAVLRERTAPGELERAKKLFAHLLAAERVWLTRLNGENSSKLEIWPAYSLELAEEQAAANSAGYVRYLESLTDAQYAGKASYRNSKGDSFETAISDILTHVALHGSYHRGQIASDMVQAGCVPPGTDFILFARQLD